MGILEDILKALDRVPIWKQLGEIPAQVDQLKQRLAAIEEKLGSKWPADVCRYCGERAARLYHVYPPDKGVVTEEWKCESCQRQDQRPRKIT